MSGMSSPAGLERTFREGGAEAARVRKNRSLVRSSTIDDWLPRYAVRSADGRRQSDVMVECEETWKPGDGAGLGVLTQLTIDPKDLRPRHGASVLGNVQGVHVNDRALYVATDAAPASRRTPTWVHRFDHSGRRPRYQASGQVDGRLLAEAESGCTVAECGDAAQALNRWALSEHEGTIRVVTRDPAPAEDDDPPTKIRTIVSALRLDGPTLEMTGRVVHRSQARSVVGIRMLGGIGVIETRAFPPATRVRLVDLHDPQRPSKAGWLPVPAYRTRYLPVSNGYLLARRGLRAPYVYTLYDTRRPEEPRLLEEVRSKTRFWSHAIEGFDHEIEPLGTVNGL
jgi:hypothetical protein